MVMMNAWAFLWLIVCLTIFVTILESIHRRLRESQIRQEELELQRQAQTQQQYHVFSLERITVPPSGVSRVRSVPTIAEQQFMHEQQELRAAKDLPPSYEDAMNCPSISIPISCSVSMSHIPSQQQRY